MNDFDEMFDKSDLPRVLGMAKTLSKEECRQIYNYMKEYSPKKILEFGVQFGCSTAVFLRISEWLGLNIELHSWDILDVVKKECVNRNDFHFHKEDISGREEEIIASYNPDMVFLDAHPYHLTKALMLSCLKHKVNFMTHDVAKDLYSDLRKRSDGFKNLDAYGQWELYIMTELFSDTLAVNDHFENDQVDITCYRDKYGLSIIKIK
ncbi:MAG: hypothetical protein WC119_06045 [Synergistaceae bacterium]